ncbi:MAG TPA: hypothetical protein VJU86_22540 [Pyrinomonadaceae bacterium]|nr:hypothetical protein [Pyrinomonadaceae bacterium]
MSDIPTLQWLVDWANIGVVVALAASLITGGASIFLSKRLGTLKDEQATREKQASDEKVASLEKETAKAVEKAETERRERLELEEAVSPRVFIVDGELQDQLRPFAGMRIIIETRPEWEPRLIADSFEGLKGIGWVVLRHSVRDDLMSEGVTVMWNRDATDPNDRSAVAGQALVKGLRERKIETSMSPAELEPNTLLIWVGLKPTRRLLPKELRDVYEQHDKKMREQEKSIMGIDKKPPAKNP